MRSGFITVTQLNKYIHSLFDGDSNLRSVFVVGEISNLRINSFSGHIYLTLKDDNSAIKAVMFKGNASRLKFVPKEGMMVICGGTVSTYERDGQYQLYINDMQPDGKGSIAEAFEQLKHKLSAEGLFDPAKKKAIPTFPKKIAIITSETGAAIQDMINVIGRRWPLSTLVMCPVRVQGDGAAVQITEAVKLVNIHTDCDLMIIGRGGGSAEDLWCFNDEALAREVFNSKIPVISAVGHETDFTILDFVADLRAPTPSAAAELSVPDISEVSIALEQKLMNIKTDINNLIKRRSEKLEFLSKRPVLTDKTMLFQNKALYLDSLNARLINSFIKKTSVLSERVASSISKLDALSPTSVLLRGFTITEKSGHSVKSVTEINNNDEISVLFADGKAYCTVNDTERNVTNG